MKRITLDVFQPVLDDEPCCTVTLTEPEFAQFADDVANRRGSDLCPDLTPGVAASVMVVNISDEPHLQAVPSC